MSVSLTEISAAAGKENNQIQLVVFALAGCDCAVWIQQVREIIRATEITLMPRAPKYLEGIINLRGRVVPVLDLKKRFDMPLLDKTDETRILVVEIKEQMIGLLVDKVVEVLKVQPEGVEQAEGPVLTIGLEFIEGLVRQEGRLVVLLGLEKLISSVDAKALPDAETA